MTINNIDVVIATIGRRSLSQAILAALRQSYPSTRVVVLADGPCPDAERTYRWFARRENGTRDGKFIYRETPKRLGGYGDFAKRYWIDSPEASEFIRFLDDDDWIPPCAIAEMMKLVKKDTAVVLCGMVMVIPSTAKGNGKASTRTVQPVMKAHHATSGTSLIRTEFARKGDFPYTYPADFSLCRDAAKHGKVEIVKLPLYWYNGHQGGKSPSFKMGIDAPYNPVWPFKPPRTFRKRLFSKVPVANYYADDGRMFSVVDQMLIRPMNRLALRRAWITRQVYYYDVTPESDKTVAHSDLRKDMDIICARGFIPEGHTWPAVPDDGGPLVRFVVPAYNCADKIGRCIDHIASQESDWRCLITIDGADTKTEAVARARVGGDPRFTITVQPELRRAPANVIDAIRRIPEPCVVCLIDADDYLLVDDLIAHLGFLYSDPDVELVCGTGRAMKMAPEAKAEIMRRARIIRRKKAHPVSPKARPKLNAKIATLEAELKDLDKRLRLERTEEKDIELKARRVRVVRSMKRVQKALASIKD